MTVNTKTIQTTPILDDQAAPESETSGLKAVTVNAEGGLGHIPVDEIITQARAPFENVNETLTTLADGQVTLAAAQTAQGNALTTQGEAITALEEAQATPLVDTEETGETDASGLIFPAYTAAGEKTQISAETLLAGAGGGDTSAIESDVDDLQDARIDIQNSTVTVVDGSYYLNIYASDGSYETLDVTAWFTAFTASLVDDYNLTLDTSLDVLNDLSGVVGWYDASDSSSLTTDTGISEWADLTTNGYDLTNSTGAEQPTVSTAASATGLDMLVFDGTDDYLASTGLGAALISGTDEAHSLHMVIATSTEDTASAMLGASQQTANASRVYLQSNNGGNIAYTKKTGFSAETVTGAAFTSSHHVVSVVHTGTSTSIWVDGVLVVDDEAHNPSADSLVDIFAIGAQVANNSVDLHADVTIGELIVANEAHSATDVADMYTYLSAKWIGS